MTIAQTINKINAQLPLGTRLVAVSKYHPVSAIQEAYAAGQRIFGESHVQELTQKYEVLPCDIEWHFIGHLQTNKVKYIAPFVSLIHAVDSDRLLREIDRQAKRCGRTIPILLQLHVAQEETKFGFTLDECRQYLLEGTWRECTGVEIRGFMCMASNVEDKEQIHSEFACAQNLFNWARDEVFGHESFFTECSWGMSDDYPIALETGSTLIRVGSRIFGNRVYT